jgi:hypothetical protein
MNVTYQDQMAQLQEKRRELRALEAAAERTAKNMRPLTESDERELMNLRARADEVYRAAGRIGAPEPTSFDRPESYRLRLAEGLKKHSATWKDADLVNAYAAGAFGVVEGQIYADARASGRTYGLKPGQIRERPFVTAAGVRIIEFDGGPDSHFTKQFAREPRRVVLKSQEEYSRMQRDAQLSRITELVRYGHRPTVQAPTPRF